ncbi:hypothetical protein GARC_4636 [Paraglaciecola arctica BSs20135]|uniref:Uncharacterized protein n=1 Tax=Paraglaciecola arctica BSs20135 TaxID=493475 RepID=K6YXU9_9ALTE|nr:hypothetical protein GARC_4636 [Paraglaciecola arctica BSs20135]
MPIFIFLEICRHFLFRNPSKVKSVMNKVPAGLPISQPLSLTSASGHSPTGILF